MYMRALHGLRAPLPSFSWPGQQQAGDHRAGASKGNHRLGDRRNTV